jgi:hypothetical protein
VSWAKFDADRGSGDKPRSADKLAEAVKSSLGDSHAAPRPGDHPGHVIEHTVASSPVVSRPVAPKRVTRAARKPLGAPAGKSTAPSTAERLVEDRNARAQSHYEKVAGRAEHASKTAKDTAGHTEAYRQHMHAANLAPTEELRAMHMKAAVAHDRVNVYEKSAAARADYLKAAKDRDRVERAARER